MANRTPKDVGSVKGTNPQFLIEKIARARIYETLYWKQHCFALTAELLVEKAVELKCIGGSVSELMKPSDFLCLTLKLLQIQPEKDIIIEFIKNEDFKYLRAIGAFYIRLTSTSVDCYKYLEPLYNDFRKLRKLNADGTYSLTYMDVFIDELLHEERVCDIILPRISKREFLEENETLEPRQSILDNLDMEDGEVLETRNDVENHEENSRRSPSISRIHFRKKRDNHKEEADAGKKKIEDVEENDAPLVQEQAPPSRKHKSHHRHKETTRDSSRSKKSEAKSRKHHKKSHKKKYYFQNHVDIFLGNIRLILLIRMCLKKHVTKNGRLSINTQDPCYVFEMIKNDV